MEDLSTSSPVSEPASPRCPADLLTSLTPGQRRCWENERQRNPSLTLEAFVKKERRVAFEQAARRRTGAQLRKDAFRRARRAQEFLYTGHLDGEARLVDVRVNVGVPAMRRKTRPRYRKQTSRAYLEPLAWLLEDRGPGETANAPVAGAIVTF